MKSDNCLTFVLPGSDTRRGRRGKGRNQRGTKSFLPGGGWWGNRHTGEGMVLLPKGKGQGLQGEQGRGKRLLSPPSRPVLPNLPGRKESVLADARPYQPSLFLYHSTFSTHWGQSHHLCGPHTHPLLSPELPEWAQGPKPLCCKNLGAVFSSRFWSHQATCPWPLYILLWGTTALRAAQIAGSSTEHFLPIPLTKAPERASDSNTGISASQLS